MITAQAVTDSTGRISIHDVGELRTSKDHFNDPITYRLPRLFLDKKVSIYQLVTADESKLTLIGAYLVNRVGAKDSDKVTIFRDVSDLPFVRYKGTAYYILKSGIIGDSSLHGSEKGSKINHVTAKEMIEVQVNRSSHGRKLNKLNIPTADMVTTYVLDKCDRNIETLADVYRCREEVKSLVASIAKLPDDKIMTFKKCIIGDGYGQIGLRGRLARFIKELENHDDTEELDYLTAKVLGPVLLEVDPLHVQLTVSKIAKAVLDISDRYRTQDFVAYRHVSGYICLQVGDELFHLVGFEENLAVEPFYDIMVRR